MERNNVEVYLGGAFGIIAIIAILVQISLERFAPGSIVSGIKDIASLGVSVLLFIYVAKSLIPKTKFDKRFEIIMDKFIAQNAALVRRGTPFLYSHKEGNPFVINGVNYNQLFLLTNFDNYFDDPNSDLTKDAAQFVLFPTFKKENYKLTDGKGTKIYFCLNKSVLKSKEISDVVAKIVNVINQTKSKDFIARKASNQFEIEVECTHNINSNDEIEQIFNLIEYVIFLYALGA